MPSRAVDQVAVELAVVDGTPAGIGRVRRVVEHLEGVAAVVLGPVHGLVGPVEEVVVAVAVLGGDGDPDRGRRRDLLAEDVERGVHGLERSLGQLVDRELVGQSGKQDGELVATHPGDGVLAADGLDEALGRPAG